MTGKMKRRDFITLLGGAAAAWPLAARAQQQAGRMRRIGILMPYAEGDTEYGARVLALRQELARLGWAEGVNVQFDERWTTNNMDRVRANAESLMASNPDVVVATGGRVVPVLMRLLARFRSFFRHQSIRSALVGWKAWRDRAAMSQALPSSSFRCSGKRSRY